jgi:hypothetical protein
MPLNRSGACRGNRFAVPIEQDSLIARCVDIACLEWRAASPLLIASMTSRDNSMIQALRLLYRQTIDGTVLSPSSECSSGSPLVLRNLPADHRRA